jgi:hypothetical protein
VDEEKIFDKRWQLASTEQRARFNNLLSSYPTIDWTFKEKKYLLWLSQLDIDTFETFEVILDKIKHSNEKRACGIYKRFALFYFATSVRVSSGISAVR